MELIIIVLTLAGLALGGQQFVAAATAIGRRLGMSPVLVGATIVAIGTSLPEWGVSVSAALQGSSDLSVGNVIGSNICNVCIILGAAALLHPLPVRRQTVFREGSIMLAATLAFLAVSADGMISRGEGFALLLGGAVAIAIFIRYGRSDEPVDGRFRWWDVPRAAVALALVLLCSHWFVIAAESLATKLQISPWAIGITLAAIGTSLPELVTSLAAVSQRQYDVVIGNVLGSNIMNVLFVLGSAAGVHPIRGNQFTLLEAAVFTAMMFVPLAMLFSGARLARWEGAALLLSGLGWYAFALSA